MAEDANPPPQPQGDSDGPHQPPPPLDAGVKDTEPRDADQPPPPPQETEELDEEEDQQPPQPTDWKDPLLIPSDGPAASADPPAGDQKAPQETMEDEEEEDQQLPQPKEERDPLPILFDPHAGDQKAADAALFTAAQLQELEQQTVIYRYMAARVPVPTHLVFPIWKTVTAASPAGAHQYPTLMGLATLCLDFLKEPEPEPGRCRRTDGKKWRCWRNVIPDQKYCERHMHRGRKRPFKPVELDDDADPPPPPVAALPAPPPVEVEDDADQPAAASAAPGVARSEDNSASNDAQLSISVSTAVGSS